MEIVLLGLLLLLAAPHHQASTPRAPNQSQAPFELRFDENGIGRGLQPRAIKGYDPQLPGYRVEAQIATLGIRPRRWQLPDKLVLAIATSRGMKPNLESLTLSAPDVSVQTSLGADLEMLRDLRDKTPGKDARQVPAGTYLRLEVVGDAVHVTFLPEAMKLLRHECKIEWVDWFRQ